MRIGTWNLAGRWSPRHRHLLEDAGCDVWLLTEVPAAFDLPGGALVRSESMTRTTGRSWAALWSAAPAEQLPSPHPAAALARLGDVLLCSCVLPWRGARPRWPDAGANTAAITLAALDRLAPSLASAGGSLVWGGDWNHAMTGREYAGSAAGRAAIQALAATTGLTVTTADAPHRIEGLPSIDHIAVPSTWMHRPARRVVAEAEGRRLSDHDAYIVDAAEP